MFFFLLFEEKSRNQRWNTVIFVFWFIFGFGDTRGVQGEGSVGGRGKTSERKVGIFHPEPTRVCVCFSRSLIALIFFCDVGFLIMLYSVLCLPVPAVDTV